PCTGSQRPSPPKEYAMPRILPRSFSGRLLGAGIALSAVILATGLGAAAVSGSESEPAAQAAHGPVSVAVARVEPRDLTAWNEFSGRLEAVERVEVRPRVAGLIENVHFREGALVKK